MLRRCAACQTQRGLIGVQQAATLAPLGRRVPVWRSFHGSAFSQDVLPFLLADIGEGITECEVLDWHVKEGDTVVQFDHICTVQSDKATVEITSRYDGVVTKIYSAAGEIANVGSPLCDITTDTVSTPAPAASEPETKTEPPAAPAAPAAAAPSGDASTHQMITTARSGQVKVLASPATRYLAKKHSLNLADIPGTGKDGRVTKGDVLQFLEGGGAPAAAASSAPTPVFAGATVEDRHEPVRGLRRTMIKTMMEATKVPHFGYSDEVLMNSLVQTRGEIRGIAEDKGVKLSYMPFFLKAASIALSEFPIVNSALTPDMTEIVYKGSHNIGVAMDTPNGLIVPNVKNCEQRSILEIAEELNRLQIAGAEGKLTASDLTGGTFTLSNVGTIGGTYTSPVLVIPEVVIGALGKMQTLPRYNDNMEIVPHQIVNVSWSADHRVIDGATLARFSNKWKEGLQSPASMLLHLR